MGAEDRIQISPESTDRSLREFLMVLRQGLLLIVRWIEKRYGLAKK